MEIGRETPDSAACVRLLEEGSQMVASALRRLRDALADRVSVGLRPPVRPCDD